MASRRTAPTRTRAATSLSRPSLGPTRPKSSLTKSSSSQHSALSTPADGSSNGDTSVRSTKQQKTQSIQPNKEDGPAETNIQVVIRCRGRSEREKQENSPIIVEAGGSHRREVVIETGVPPSSMGGVKIPQTRTYPFDHVFGPEADQTSIYHDVVAPMLAEVLSGYNCTLFAYGQTGTGKTHTMAGDLTLTPLGNPSRLAGMIPRVLFHLFHQLESSVTDYSVKISYIELYNEELRDLLIDDLPAPAGSAQPMGMGSKDALNRVELKIFDDSSKKGVHIQGLEEISVKSMTDALALLTKGSERRQIASTKFNDHSSRSHSIFSITVYAAEDASLLKVGKLNLVDLAGSENIGRSGAENKRAREAGMINQSLLTLGRVINALVDRASHVPYRESKLTRLLQDSLGGRTKTCIIATISPARSNMEETLSTLDYALRAKSIRNKPEVNQHMPKDALVQDYVALVTRLKAELHAAREKQGVYFSDETWSQMVAEQELRETEMKEMRKQIEILEAQLQRAREEFEELMGLFMKKDAELKATKEKLAKAECELQVKGGQLDAVKIALEEEVVVRQAYQMSETVLDSVADRLKALAQESTKDLGGLFNKLDRKNSVLGSNAHAVATHTRTLNAESKAFSTKFDEYAKSSDQRILQLKTEAEQTCSKVTEVFAGLRSRVAEELEKVQEATKTVNVKDQQAEEAMGTIRSTVTEIQESIKISFTSWSDEVRQSVEEMAKQMEASATADVATVENAFKHMDSVLETLFKEAQNYIATERKSLQEARELADGIANAEVARLKQQNVLLIRLLESEKLKADRAGEDLKQKIATLVSAFTADRDRSLREAFSEMADSNTSAEKEMNKLAQQQGQQLDGVQQIGAEWGLSVERRRSEAKRTRDGGLKSLEALSSSIRTGFSDIPKAVGTSSVRFSSELSQRIQQNSTKFNDAYDGMSRAKRARIDATNNMSTEVQSAFRYTQRSIASASRTVDSGIGHVLSQTSSLSNELEAHRAVGSSHIGTLRQASQALSEQGMREDVPTGSTPRKRSWDIVDTWSLTNRDTVLDEFRRRDVSSSNSDEFVSEDFALPSLPDSVSERGGSEIESIAEEDEDFEMEGQDDTIKVASPIQAEVKSLASSTSSSSSSGSIAPNPPTLLKRPQSTLKSGLPTRGTLTERPTNLLGLRVTTRRTTRR